MPDWKEQDSAEFFLEQLPVIRRITTALARQKALSSDDTDELVSLVLLRMIDRNYEILRRFDPAYATLPTYLAVVIRRILTDYLQSRWGKWRPSAEAKRHGEHAMQAEELVNRDGRDPEEAFAILHARFPDLSREKFETIMQRLPARARRRMIAIDNFEDLITATDEPFLSLVLTENANRITTVVTEFLDELPPEDRLLLQLRFESDMTVAQIARSLQRDQQSLYRRLYGHFRVLRERLEKAGLRAADVEALIESNAALLDFRLRDRNVSPTAEPERAWRMAQVKEP